MVMVIFKTVFCQYCQLEKSAKAFSLFSESCFYCVHFPLFPFAHIKCSTLSQVVSSVQSTHYI